MRTAKEKGRDEHREDAPQAGCPVRLEWERQDERAQIAAYLHDDLAQLLFRLSLQVDITKRHLRNATPEQVGEVAAQHGIVLHGLVGTTDLEQVFFRLVQQSQAPGQPIS